MNQQIKGLHLVLQHEHFIGTNKGVDLFTGKIIVYFANRVTNFIVPKYQVYHSYIYLSLSMKIINNCKFKTLWKGIIVIAKMVCFYHQNHVLRKYGCVFVYNTYYRCNACNACNGTTSQVVTNEKALHWQKVGAMKKRQMQCGAMHMQCIYRMVIKSKVLNIRYIS